jgi:membrane protein
VSNVFTKALNIAFEAKGRYGFWKRTLIRFGMLLSLGLASSSVLRLLHDWMGVLPGAREVVFNILVHLLPSIFILVAFFLSYRFVPRRRPHWRAALAGATVAMVLFAAAGPLFLGYVHEMARYNIIYGSLAGIIVVVLWTWVVAMIGLFGGEVASNTQAIFIDARTPDRVERRHRARSN